ncbi:hypothetical protein BGW80DRAFT_1335321 [Lactifluus volemus]|nr:hypothetical protein BGW80DRAFT_1335321 [Lactifluus volemus]
MTRAMVLIKMYFVGSLRALTQDVSRRLFEQLDSLHLFLEDLGAVPTHTLRTWVLCSQSTVP